MRVNKRHNFFVWTTPLSYQNEQQFQEVFFSAHTTILGSGLKAYKAKVRRSPSLSHFARDLVECDGTGVEGLVKGQIKPALTVMSIKPSGQRLLSEQYLSL